MSYGNVIFGQMSRVGRPGRREAISLGPSSIGKIQIEEAGRIFLRVRKEMRENGRLGEREMKDLLRVE